MQHVQFASGNGFLDNGSIGRESGDRRSSAALALRRAFSDRDVFAKRKKAGKIGAAGTCGRCWGSLLRVT